MRSLLVSACISSLLFLQGCAATPSRTRVEVPVVIACRAPEVAKPKMHFDTDATESMSLYDKLSLLLAQNYALKGYVTQLEAVVKACKQQ